MPSKSRAFVYTVVGNKPGFLIILAFFCGSYLGAPMEYDIWHHVRAIAIGIITITVYWMSTFYERKNDA